MTNDIPAPCPFCGAKAIDITVSGEFVPRFMCCGDECHEWREGEGPELLPQESEPDPIEEIADTVVRKLRAEFTAT